MAFSPSKLYALFLILMIFVSTAPPILAGPPCSKEHPKKGHKKEPKAPPVVVKPPPVIVKPPPVIVKPPPVIVKPSPPIVVTPPVVTPPVTTPPVYTPPVVTPLRFLAPPPPPPPATCPIDSLKLGACVDLLGGLVHIGVGDPVVNHCCPILGGLVELEAAVCLCTTIKLKLLNLNIILPLALKLLVTCGKTPPPGFTCPN